MEGSSADKARGTPVRKELAMRRVFALSMSVFALLLASGVDAASGDPVNSPRVDSGTIVCGDVTYTLVSPLGAPVSQALTANGSNSTTVSILILHKAATNFPQNLLTLCTAFPPGEPPFETFFLITPAG
jgi:hypothetical protein